MMDADINSNNNIHSGPYYAKEDEEDSIYTTSTSNRPTQSVYSDSTDTDKMNNFNDENYRDSNNHQDYDANHKRAPVYDTDDYDEEENDSDYPNNRRPDSNQPPYRDNYDDKDDVDADAENDALFRANNRHHNNPHRKTTCCQRMKRCCATCYTPKCAYRGPWYVGITELYMYFCT